MNQSTTVIKKKRLANMELLRIIAMMMVIMLHYLGKGNMLPEMEENLVLNGYIAWILEALCIVAVNVYMLISGYFLIETSFKCKRVIQLICQVFFYSILIVVILLAMGFLQVQDVTFYQIQQYVFPIQMKPYWFATAYIILYLFTPLLNVAVKNMKRKQLLISIIILLLFFSISKSIMPIHLQVDEKGYDAIWFICVYLVAAYIRLYGIPFYKNGRKSFLFYLLGCGGVLGISLIKRFIYFKTGMLGYTMTDSFDYNHILNLFASVSIFYVFYYIKIPDGKIANWIIRIAPYTFGVYLLHEHLEIRYIWPQWLWTQTEGNPLLFILRNIGGVLVVFTIGIIVDMIRKLLFDCVEKSFIGREIDKRLVLVDDIINGRTE